MPNVFIIHGTCGHPEENWFPWLKAGLERFGCIVFVPAFPTPRDQTLQNWLFAFKPFEQHLDEEAILVGHSIGCAFILNLLEKLNRPIASCFLVAGFLKKLNIKKYVELNKTFVDKDFNWSKIKQNCKRFYVFNSDNDPHVPLEKGQELAQKLEVKLTLVKNAGHFNEAAGYTRFDLLLEKIKQEL